MNKEELFEKESILKLMGKLCVPSTVTILVMIIYNMADMYFVGQLGNPLMVASISLTMPLSSILSAIGTLIGGGACTAMAINFGKKDYATIKQMSSFCFYISIVLGILYTLVMMVFHPQILELIGTSPDTYAHTRTYMCTLFLGAPIILLCSVFSNAIRSTGAAKDAMVGNLIGTITNIILDPILIIFFNLGLKGAAIATIIGNTFALIYYMRYIIKNHSASFSFRIKDFTLRPEISIEILSLGIPTALGVLLISISGIIKNNAFKSYGDIVIAASGIIGRITMIIGMLQIGITTGIQPAIGYNFGSKNLKRINEIVKTTAITTFTIGFVLTVLGRIFGDKIIAAFINDADVIEVGKTLIVGSLISGPIVGWSNLSINYLQAAQKAKIATLLSTLRQGIIFIPVLYLMHNMFGLMGVVYSNAISDIIATIISVSVCYTIYRRQIKPTLG